VTFFIYTDSTGAEYRLDQSNANVWTSKEGVYVSYDANSRRLYFNDGTFWYMGSEAAGTEFYAGSLFPTLMQDTNGNQIKITYRCGANAPCAVPIAPGNSSSRIATITDATSPGTAYSYTFGYTNERLAVI
jgi:hypothetical protein